MLKLIFIILLIHNVSSYRMHFKPPVYPHFIGDQPCSLLIDINLADTYIIKEGLIKHPLLEGYNPLKSKNSKNLNRKFAKNLDLTINDHESIFSGTIIEDKQFFNPETLESFGLIEKFEGIPTTAFYNDSIITGRLGINPWLKSQTTLSGKVSKSKIFGLVAKCYTMNLEHFPKFCNVGWGFGQCMENLYSNVSKTKISFPLKQNVKDYWQIEANSYKFDKSNFYRKFDIIFSTTTLDITVPGSLFNMVVRELKPTKTVFGYEFDCAKRNNAKDIILSVDNNDIVIEGNIYADQVYDKCYLRLNPGKSNDWVLGLQFYYSYAACFNGKDKVVQLNKSLYREL